jgi:hypothetical protein
MRNHYGWRALLVVLLLALGCRLGLAQIGPRYVLQLPGAPQAAPAAAGKGELRMLGKGMMLLRFQDLVVLMLNADVRADDNGADWPHADLAVVTSARGWMEHCGALAAAAARLRLPMIVAELDGAPAAEAPCYPLQTWDMLNLRKGKTRLWTTAMAGAAGVPGVGGFMLDLGDNHFSYRVYLSAEQSMGDVDGNTLLERLPGADMIAWQDGATQRTVQRGESGAAPQPTAPVTFAARRR